MFPAWNSSARPPYFSLRMEGFFRIEQRQDSRQFTPCLLWIRGEPPLPGRYRAAIRGLAHRKSPERIRGQIRATGCGQGAGFARREKAHPARELSQDGIRALFLFAQTAGFLPQLPIRFCSLSSFFQREANGRRSQPEPAARREGAGGTDCRWKADAGPPFRMQTDLNAR